MPRIQHTCVAFVDYEKAFDSVQTQAILASLQGQGIEDMYIEILKDAPSDYLCHSFVDCMAGQYLGHISAQYQVSSCCCLWHASEIAAIVDTRSVSLGSEFGSTV